MTEVVVWVMVLSLTNYSGTASVVIDNIASAESCDKLASVFRGRGGVNDVVCAPVKKLVVKNR